MNDADFKTVLRARNRTKRQHKIYIYEAMKNMLDGYGGNSVSENCFGIVAAFLERTGHKMDFLTEKDRLIINKLRRAITSNK